MKKAGYIVFSALFSLVCVIPVLGIPIFGESTAAANEVLSPQPRMTDADGNINTEVLKETADYLSDHFALRQELITADSAIKAAVFNTSSDESVTLGKDGWLFYSETVGIYTGAELISEREAFCIARSMKLAENYASEKGAAFVFTIAPDKISLYPEYAPDGLVRAEETSADRLLPFLDEQEINYVNLFEKFGEQDEILYHRLDSHWTNKGAALAHDAILPALGVAGYGMAFEKEGTMAETYQGDLYAMLYPASKKLDSQFEFSQPLDFSYIRQIRGYDDIRIETEGSDENGPLLMFRDSFGNALHCLMAENFERALFSRSVPYNLGLMDELSAKYVVLEIVERNIPLLLENSFVMPAPEIRPEYTATGSGAQLSLSTQESNLSGFVMISGKINDGADIDSPVYIEASGRVFEAFPTGGDADDISFFAYLPEGVSLGDARLVYKKGEEWLFALS